ncbi:MAG: ABC transporter substrate-binding protein [Bacteroidetes bacterium]|nr:ABC transporter substrate-binding protein [Bacteroidota bacterium]
MFVKRYISLHVLAILFMSSPITAQSSFIQTEVQTLLETRDQQIKQLLGAEGSEYSDQQRSQLKDIVNGIIDFDAMAKTALESTYDTISVETRDEFIRLFSSIIRDQSLVNLDIYRAVITYETINGSFDSTFVQTIAEWDNIRTPVHYKMKKESGEWKITDMSIDDVFTAESYNRQFQRIIASRGFNYLMDTLRKRAERNS